jgi:hypothetical protein
MPQSMARDAPFPYTAAEITYSWATPRSHQFQLQTVRFTNIGLLATMKFLRSALCSIFRGRTIANCKLGPAP